MAVEITCEYLGNLHCSATHGPSGQTFTTDAPVDNGGKGEMFSPTDLVATAMATCIMTIMGLVARDNGWDLAGTRARVTKEMVADPKRRIGALTLTVTLPTGIALSHADRTCLEDAAKACPVRQSLRPEVQVDVDFEYAE